MAYLRFLNGDTIHKAIVIPMGNIVTLKFDGEKEVSTSGFNLYLDEECTVDIGGKYYHIFTTIYRNDNNPEMYNGYQLSNDGSVWVRPPEMDTEPYVPTLEELIEKKVSDMNAQQQQVIRNGANVTLSDGTVEHFTLKDQDQTSLMGLQTQVLSGEENIPWHNSNEDEHCKFYSNTDMALITNTSMNFVTWHVTYFRDLRIYIRSLKTKEEVESVFYGMDIPAQYQSEPLKAMISAQQI